MKLVEIYANTSKITRSGHHESYLFTVGGTAPKDAFFGLYVQTDKKPSFPSPMTLSQAFGVFKQNDTFIMMVGLYFKSGVGSGGADALGAALDQVKWDDHGVLGDYQGVVHWLDSAEIDPAVFGSTAHLPMEALFQRGKTSTTTPLLVLPETHPLIKMDAASAALHLAAKPGRIEIGATAADDGFLLTPFQQSQFAVTIEAATPAKTGQLAIAGTAGMSLSLTGPQMGCLVGDLTLKPRVGTVGSGLGFTYGVDVTAATGATSLASGPLDYPLLDVSTSVGGLVAKMSLNPLAPTDPSQTFVAPKPNTALQSAYRTRFGQGVTLTTAADGSARFALNDGYAGVRYFTPHGTFTLSVPDAPNPAAPADLLCGLSGVEYIAFEPGDALVFDAGQPAGITATINPLLVPPENVTFAPSSSPVTTAGAVVIGKSTRAYFSEPDLAPLYTPDTPHKTAQNLSYFPLTRLNMPPAASGFFPMMPYAAITKTKAGLGSDPEYVRAFELQFLNPTRQTKIAELSAKISGKGSGGIVTALTPQGYAATFNDGIWTALEVARMQSGSAVDINLTFGDPTVKTALPENVQSAFLTNQQFVVISELDAVPSLKPVITMNGWPFDLLATKNTTLGDYRNVLIFKSANATLAQLAKNPSLWTQRGAFTDTKNDPNGTFLSQWMTTYFEEARALYNNGNGVASLKDFVSLIDDKNWNGFIALRVSVDTKSLPAEVEALLAGIDKNLFVAHHLGNMINHVAPSTKSTGTYDLNSSVFGLIHYSDPAFDASKETPAYYDSPQDYDFRVLTLEAVFKNAELTHFSNKSMLLMNEMFGDRVDATRPKAAVDPHNNVILIGTYKSTGGKSSYEFATAPGKTARFYLSSNAYDFIDVTKANMTVTTVKDPGGGEHFVAKFGLAGDMRFLDQTAFDLLSFERLGFQNLAITMDILPGGDDPQFEFVTNGINLAEDALRSVKPGAAGSEPAGFSLVRDGAFLTQFPMRLKGFVTGQGNQAPADKGFRALETTAPSGISAASITGDWYALSFQMNLGGQGALGPNNGIAADLMLAWTPGGSGGAVNISPEFKLVGPGGVSLSFDIEGVLKFGAKDIILNKIPSNKGGTADAFVMVFESIAVSVLSLSFPPAGTTNVILLGGLGDPPAPGVVNPTLGWFGGYVAKEPGKAKSVATSKRRTRKISKGGA